LFPFFSLFRSGVFFFVQNLLQLPALYRRSRQHHGEAQITTAEFGHIYSTANTVVGVTFTTSDDVLQRIYDKAVSCEEGNRKEFLPGLHVVVEGSVYRNVWLETQPMGGAMWAARNVTEALANSLVFLRTQRVDGRLPGMVSSATDGVGSSYLTAMYCYARGDGSLLQGNYWSVPAVDVAFFMNQSVPDGTGGPDMAAYVGELHVALEAFDDWMWRTRHGRGTETGALIC